MIIKRTLVAGASSYLPQVLKPTAILLLTLVHLAVAINQVQAADYFTHTLKLAISSRQADVIQAAIEDWTDTINSGSNDRFNITIQRNNDEAALLGLLLDGTIDLAWINLNYYPGRLTWANIMSFPGRTGDSALLSTIMWRLHNDYFDQQRDFGRMQVLAFTVFPAQRLRFSRKVTGLDNFAPQSLRCRDQVCSDFMQQLGVPITIATDHRLLQMIDNDQVTAIFEEAITTELSPQHEALRSRTPYILLDDIAWPRTTYALVISDAVWRAIDPVWRQLISRASGEDLSESLGAAVDSAHRNYTYNIPILDDFTVEWSLSDREVIAATSLAYRLQQMDKNPRLRVKLRQVDAILNFEN